jgi:hypothetical protein
MFLLKADVRKHHDFFFREAQPPQTVSPRSATITPSATAAYQAAWLQSTTPASLSK